MEIRANTILVNYRHNPYTDKKPYFSWKLESRDNGEIQSGYRILVRSGKETYWDSGYVSSSDTVGIEYKGKKLNSMTKYEVEVTSIGTIDKKEHKDKSWFRTGKLDEPWQGKWITGWYYNSYYGKTDSPLLRKEFVLKNKVKNAQLYICGLGYFEARINGNKVGDEFIAVPFTKYDVHAEYFAYDVTGLLEKENAIAVLLGNGFYNCFTDDPWQTAVAEWRDVPKMKCELHIDYSDGTKEIIVSDPSWLTSHSPITFNGVRHGESYDANLEENGVYNYGFDTSKGEWKPARRTRGTGGKIILSEQEPVRVVKKFHPISKNRTDTGTWVFDAGIDVAGVCNIRYKGKKGEKITVKYGDHLSKEGHVDHQAINSFIKNYYFQTEEYTKKSDEPECHNSIFTYFGFQHLEVEGGEELSLDDIEVWVFCNDIESRGHFRTEDSYINKIQEMARRSTESCLIGTFAADTVREKSSWTGDTGLSSEQIFMNYAAESFMSRWMMDMRESQRIDGGYPCIVPSTGWGYIRLNGPDWSQPAVEVPLHLYESTGDKTFLRENYEEITRHIDNMTNLADGCIAQFGLGDWCPPFDGPAISVNMSSYKCPVRITDTGYYYSAVVNAQKWARTLGKSKDARKYGELAENIKKAFISRFIDKDGIPEGNCQTATGTVIYRGLYPKGKKAFYAKLLKKQIVENNGKLDFGVLGMKAVSNAMGETGQAECCLDMLRGPEYPSYGHWVDMGSTTLYECWNGLGSHNHHMFSDVSEFFYKYVGGISTDYSGAGYRKILLRPALIRKYGNVECSIDTVRGLVQCNSTFTDSGAVLDVVIPVGSEAKLILPKGWKSEVKTLKSGTYKIIATK